MLHELQHDGGRRRRSGKRLLGFSDGNPERRFYFRLARDLGMTVAELLTRMSSTELTEWIALYRIEHSEREQAAERARAQAKR